MPFTHNSCFNIALKLEGLYEWSVRSLLLVAILLVAILLVGFGNAAMAQARIDKNYKFLFFAVLEGCYEEGLSDQDVAVLLSKPENAMHNLFIYACPVCEPVRNALITYAARKKVLFGKSNTATFGAGLDPNLQRLLKSENMADHLTVLNGLVAKWIEKRIADQKISGEALASLEKDLEKLREEGMQRLTQFRKNGSQAEYAPAFADIDECAACNAAVGKPMPMAAPIPPSAPAP